jgi:Zn-finger nucleic acid-binding protein
MLKEYKYSDRVVYKKCPICRDLMNRKSFGARSGVVIDICKEHGTWLNGGELRKLMEWKRAGGLLLTQEREEQRKQYDDKQERLRQKRHSEFVGNSHGSQNSNFAFHKKGHNSGDLLSLSNISDIIYKIFM